MTGALMGGILGAAVGGRGVGNRLAGAAVGAVAGGLVGSAIGASMDEEDRQMAYAAEMQALEYGAPGRRRRVAQRAHALLRQHRSGPLL